MLIFNLYEKRFTVFVGCTIFVYDFIIVTGFDVDSGTSILTKSFFVMEVIPLDININFLFFFIHVYLVLYVNTIKHYYNRNYNKIIRDTK